MKNPFSFPDPVHAPQQQAPAQPPARRTQINHVPTGWLVTIVVLLAILVGDVIYSHYRRYRVQRELEEVGLKVFPPVSPDKPFLQQVQERQQQRDAKAKP